MAEILFFILGVACFLYFMGIVWYAGLSSKFPFFWIAAGLVFLTGWTVLHFSVEFPSVLCRCVLFIGILLIGLFFGVEARILSAMFQKKEKHLDYLIVLGAQVKGQSPSLSLAYRIDEAERYLRENLCTKAILSGGKGENEGISEAECMYRELAKRGIAVSRLLKEEQSVNTEQNIFYSYQILKREWQKAGSSCRVGIVTSGFHVYRGTAIARKKTDCQVYGIPAKSSGFLQANYLVREFLGVLKDRAAGNL